MGAEFFVHFALACISLILFTIHLNEVFKTFYDNEFKSMKLREIICSIVLATSFLIRALINLILKSTVISVAQLGNSNVQHYYIIFEDYRNQFLNPNLDWLDFVVCGITPIVSMQLMVDWPFAIK